MATVFGIIKAQMGLRSFSLRGLEAVREEWTLAGIAFNVKRMGAMQGGASSGPEKPCKGVCATEMWRKFPRKRGITHRGAAKLDDARRSARPLEHRPMLAPSSGRSTRQTVRSR